jgi:hypothetical protein
MVFVYNNIITYDAFPEYSSFIPCCNVPVAVDGLYQSQHIQEVYYAPEPPPQIQVVRQRLPDPPPDVIDRVVVVPQPKQYVYQVVEVPTKPPPVVRDRVVHQSPNPPLCGGTYQVKVPSKSNVVSPRLVQSSSNVQVSPKYVQASPSYIQAPPTYVQASPSYIQAPPTYVQASSVIQPAPLFY